MTTALPPVLRDHALAVLDLEGNGGQPPEIVEVAILPVDGAPVTEEHSRSWLVRPKNRINGIAHRIHGIGNTDVESCPSWRETAPAVQQLLDGRTVVAHSAGGDYRVLGEHLPSWRPPMVLDTLRLARKTWPGLPGYGLSDLVTHADLPIGDTTGQRRPHRAGFDTWCTWLLLLALVEDANPTWDELVATAALPQFAPIAEPEGGLW